MMGTCKNCKFCFKINGGQKSWKYSFSCNWTPQGTIFILKIWMSSNGKKWNRQHKLLLLISSGTFQLGKFLKDTHMCVCCWMDSSLKVFRWSGRMCQRILSISEMNYSCISKGQLSSFFSFLCSEPKFKFSFKAPKNRSLMNAITTMHDVILAEMRILYYCVIL